MVNIMLILHHLAAEVKGFVGKEHMDFKAAKRMELFAQYAVAAAKEAGSGAWTAPTLRKKSILPAPRRLPESYLGST